ncbi:MAG: hypothetical protein EOO60_01580 [Hymenobacter sp.]|nr:MAG: hypothetical protein EOO60_01580 [Hymenobacter sp.]
MSLLSPQTGYQILLVLGLLTGAMSCSSESTPSSPATMPTAAAFFPTQLPYEKAQIPKLFGIIDDTEGPDSALHYQVMVPLTWGQVKLPWQPLSPTHPSQLQLQMKARTGPAVELKVVLVYTQEETSPTDVLLANLAKNEERVLQQRVITQPGGAVPDVLTLRGTPKNEQISRWAVLKNSTPKTGGACLFILCISTAAQDYNAEMANIFYMATNNFKVLHPNPWPYAEQLRTLVRVAPLKIATAFPRSWQQKENPLSNEQFYQIQLTKDYRGQQIGRISLTTLANQTTTDVDHLEQELLSIHAKEGLVFAPASYQDTLPAGGLDTRQTTLSQQFAVSDALGQERHAVRGQVGPYWLLMESIQFTCQADPEAWAISKRAFEIVQQHLVLKP